MTSTLAAVTRINSALLTIGPAFAVLLTMLPASPAQSQSYGFTVGDRLPVFTHHGEDGVTHHTDEFRGRWFLFKRGADWCAPCLAERPGLDAFMRAHPEVPVVMMVATNRASPAGADPQRQMLRDVAYQRSHGFDPRIVVVQDSRQPNQDALPAPKDIEPVPLTAVIDPNGVIVALWTSTHRYERFYDRKGITGRSEPRFRDYVEAILLCKGATLPSFGEDARALVPNLDASCS
ncbi:thioredoxin family protein [Azospirillum sp. 11R-A]|uniref:TlpA family protein disulfide reductase n=1 Tax=Azospirillum sp. 11R-A TaxID=3111634 RepID=UPI003C29AEF1